MDLSNILIEPTTKNKHGAILMKIFPKAPSITPIVNELDFLFEKLNDKFFESSLSKPVITLSEEGRRNAYGWCTTEKVWQNANDERHYEINVCPEHLNRPIEYICGTLLHEMVHLKNLQDGIQDCSRSSQYHNKRFKLCAEQHGLNVTKTLKYGFADTSLKNETLEFIKTLKLNAFGLFRNLNIIHIGTDDETENKLGGSTKMSSTRKYICPVCPKTSFWASKEIRVRCDVCNELFIEIGGGDSEFECNMHRTS